MAQFPPSPWGHFFVDYVQDVAKLDEWAERAQVLKEEVKLILRNALGTPSDHELSWSMSSNELVLDINLKMKLKRHYTEYTRPIMIMLRILIITKEAMISIMWPFDFAYSEREDTRHQLGEDILDEAIGFTIVHLNSSLPNILDPLFAKQVRWALELPTQKRLLRTNARYFISLYEEINDATNSVMDPETYENMCKLLEYAKLDFNLVQAIHQREVKEVSRWWKEKGLAEKLSYARDRVVECYVWVMSTAASEPRFSQSRVFGAKTFNLISLTDDTYDAYGVYEELKQYTDSIERWDLAAMDDFPEYVKPLYHEYMTLFKDTEEELEKEGYSYQIVHMKQAVQELCRAYFTEAEWYHNRYTPGSEEYKRVSLVTSAYHASFLLTMVYMKEASIDVIEWWNSMPRIIMAATEIGRFIDDPVTNKFEQERGHVVSGIECFMEEKGMTRQEVQYLFKHFYDVAWKDINEACLHPRPFPMYILSKAVNLARVMDAWYNSHNADEYTFSGGRTKEMITELLVNAIPV
ncbi:hypothetical protein H6P81_007087 [Aristolochia fimbriata]|uniref:Terpene synthase metal-binding domain-containing protein n=1 Tax=Aristolochia fimbriata TaxID=158543 RepID=A0AAV7EZI1_ARIFI|nr:hypothetical protein H6P81_007087 [Aristolochia fimbriata]